MLRIFQKFNEKGEITDLSHNLYNIDLQIQDVRAHRNRQNEIKRSETAIFQDSKEVMDKEIQLEIKNAQSRRGR